MKNIKNVWILAVIFLSVACASNEESDETPINPDPNPGQSTDTAEDAPDFELIDTDGNTVKLNDFNGKVTVMFFFGNSCPTCKTAGPQIQSQLADVYGSNTDFAIVGLDVWNGNSTSVKSFKTTTGINFPLLLNASSTASAYKTSYDRLIVVDKVGKIRFKGKQLAFRDLSKTVDTVKTYLDK